KSVDAHTGTDFGRVNPRQGLRVKQCDASQDSQLCVQLVIELQRLRYSHPALRGTRHSDANRRETCYRAMEKHAASEHGRRRFFVGRSLPPNIETDRANLA